MIPVSIDALEIVANSLASGDDFTTNKAARRAELFPPSFQPFKHERILADAASWRNGLAHDD